MLWVPLLFEAHNVYQSAMIRSKMKKLERDGRAILPNLPPCRERCTPTSCYVTTMPITGHVSFSPLRAVATECETDAGSPPECEATVVAAVRPGARYAGVRKVTGAICGSCARVRRALRRDGKVLVDNCSFALSHGQTGSAPRCTVLT